MVSPTKVLWQTFVCVLAARVGPSLASENERCSVQWLACVFMHLFQSVGAEGMTATVESRISVDGAVA